MKVKDKVVLVHAMQAYGRGEAELHSLLTSLLDGGVCSASRLGRFTPGEGHLGTH